MSIENKIKELLERTQAAAQDSTDDTLNEAEQAGAASVKKDTSITAANAGDTTQTKQGSSENASFEERDEMDSNPGAKVSKSISKNSLDTKGDAKSVKTQAMEETEVTAEEETIAEEQMDVRSELDSIFGEELSEDFRSKAASIFEAAVIARVNAETQAIVEELEQQNEAAMAEFKEGLVEKVDSYLNYVVENWMTENELAIENGLRTEIAEDFIQGLKVLFKEHYIEVPEEKYDVIGELQTKAEALEAKLNESINNNVELSKEVVELKRSVVMEEATKDLAATEAEKLAKLVEGVEFESEEIFKEKLSVIKETYFPKSVKPSAEQTLTEDVAGSAPILGTANDTIAAYAQALSRSIKR